MKREISKYSHNKENTHAHKSKTSNLRSTNENRRSGRNFGVKMGVAVQKEKGPEARVGENGEDSSDSGVWENVVSSPSGIHGGADRKRFYCNLISADRLCRQQMTANFSPFRPEKTEILSKRRSKFLEQ